MTMTDIDLSNRYGYLTNNEVLFIHELVNSLDNRATIVNIGAGAGTSALAIWQSGHDIRVCYTVDIRKDSSPFGCLEGEYNALMEAGLWDNINHEQVHSDSKLFAFDWIRNNLGNIDMVFIDGDHSFAGCAGDIISWLYAIEMCTLHRKPIIAIHDYESEDWKDVKEATEMIFNHNKYYKFLKQVDTLIAFQGI